MGGAGLYSLSQIVLFEAGPSDRPSLMGGLIGITLAVSYVLGPILGAVISSTTEWTVIFWIKYVPSHTALVVHTNDYNFWQRPSRYRRHSRPLYVIATGSCDVSERMELGPKDRFCWQHHHCIGMRTTSLRSPGGRSLHICLGQSGHCRNFVSRIP